MKLPPSLALLCSALACPMVFAQTTLASVIVTGREATRLDRSTSTGSQLGLSPLQTPASIDIIDREQLEARGDVLVIDAITRSTGITSLGHPGNSGSSLSARGFTDSASVMRLYDGSRQYGGVAVSFPFGTASIERIEVLRGPASVVHGDGAIGGVVNVVPKKPSRGPIGHKVQVRLGTRAERAVAFGSGGSASEHVSYRVDANADRSDGWVDRGQHSGRTFSGAIQWEAAPSFDLKLSHSQGQQRPMRYFGMPLIDGQPNEAIRERNYNVADSAMVFNDHWTELAARWTPNSRLALRSRLYRITSVRDWRNAEGYTYNPLSGLIDRSDNTEIRHEQRQTGNTTDATFTAAPLGLPNQFVLGFDINRSAFRHTNNTYTGSSPSVDPFHPEPGLFVSAAPFIPRYQNDADQYALFAENRVELTPAWSVIAGARRDDADVSRVDLVTGTPAFDRRYSSTGWRIGTVYLLQPQLSVYAQYAKAADPVSGLLMLSPANSRFDISYGQQIEFGLKQSFWEHRGHWTFALYEIRKNNLLTRDTENPDLRLQAGERSSSGVEASVLLPLGRSVQLDANIALLRARYDDFNESVSGVAVSREGKVPTDVPQRTANLWVDWKALPGWTLSGGARYVGKRFADNANAWALPAYTVADAAVQWQPADRTTVTLRGFNVFDTHYFTTAYYMNTQWFVGEGRRIELSLNHKF